LIIETNANRPVDIFQEINNKIAAGESFVLATIVKTVGSSPRRVGARMLVFPDGSISGTIGGGIFEKLVIDDCLGMLKDGRNHLLKNYRFTEQGPDATGMHCGGEADVFMEANGNLDRLIIFGGGHVGRDLVRVASGLNFRITVVDDRAEILDPYKPPVETVLTDPDYNENFPKIDSNCYVVIVTHGHKCDQSVLGKIADKDLAYIGMIGSKAKVTRTFSALKKKGIKESYLKRVHAPVGLDIGAEGPYEIAISIAAELIAVKRKLKKN
jgi:xanthine dehydrogenase accessory factor